MRLGGRLAAAIEVLEDMERRKRPAADALKDWGLSHRFAGSGDRSAIGNIVYDALRRRRSAGWLTGDDMARGQAFGALLLEWGLSANALNAALDGDKFAPQPLSAEELAAIASRDLANAPDAVRADLPDWCQPQFEAAFGEAWVAEAAALARARRSTCGSTPAGHRDKVLADLVDIGAIPTDIAPQGMRVAPIAEGGRHPNVQVEPAFQKGWFEIQDEGSQIVAQLSGAKPGMQVLDYCAGGGGKTLAMSAQMDNKGQIFAYDSEKARIAPIFDRLRRAECRNVQVIAGQTALSALEGQMDMVLVDAPCTGTGTWRRRPDAKWRLSDRQVEVRMREQSTILDAVARFVKPGGAIAFITCSVFRDENQSQAHGFLERHADFSFDDHKAIWTENFGTIDASPRIGADGIVLTPATTATDGFYFAMLRKAG
jgi:16S rRNA (cytosine967-C5)-methyltransferase